MKITFIGVGSAFTLPANNKEELDLNKCDWQSNLMVTANSGKKMLIDCGSDIRFALAQQGIFPAQYPEHIDAIYISHLHGDHVGGVETVSFCNYFNPNKKTIKLYCVKPVMDDIWDTLKGALATIQGKVMTLTDYFEKNTVQKNNSFFWEGIRFTPIQTVHVRSGACIKFSFGLLIQELDNDTRTIVSKSASGVMKSIGDMAKSSKPLIFFTSDTQACPSDLKDFYKPAHTIFHDCETGFQSGVHSHFLELEKYAPEIKEKMYLYHYQPHPKQDAVASGFRGFITKGQVFEF